MKSIDVIFKSKSNPIILPVDDPYQLKELACLGFNADLVMQSFCHTAAYPKPVDIKTHKELPDFFSTRGGVALRPGDGIAARYMVRTHI